MTTKVCTKCRQEKDASEFTVNWNFKDGLNGRCRSCVSIANRKYYEANRSGVLDYMQEHHRAHLLKRDHNMTVEEYDTMFIRQEGRCAICNRHQDVLPHHLCVDHDHETNKTRGLLCYNCNAILGHARDDRTVLEKAIAYLAEC